MKITDGAVRFVEQAFKWSCQQADVLFEGAIKKAAEMGKHILAYTDGPESILQPFYWKNHLEETLKSDLSIGTNINNLGDRLQKYTLFFQQCCRGGIALDPGRTLEIICKGTKNADPTLHAFVLVNLALPLLHEHHKCRISLFNTIYANLNRVDLSLIPALIYHFRMQLCDKKELDWWNQNIKRHLTDSFFNGLEREAKNLESSERGIKRACNAKEKPFSPLKISLLALLVFSHFSQAAAQTFNTTRFFEAARQWNYSNGPFNVFNQLVEQEWCKPTGTCVTPKNLIPNEVAEVTDFYWNALFIDRINHPSLLTLNNNSFYFTGGEFAGNFAFKGGTIQQNSWGLHNETKMIFENQSIKNSGLNVHSGGNFSISYVDCYMDGASMGNPQDFNYLSANFLNISNCNTTKSSFSGLHMRIEKSVLNASRISGLINDLAIRHSNLNSFCIYLSQINKGSIDETIIQNGTVVGGPVTMSVKNSPLVEFTLFNTGCLRQTEFQNITDFKLTRDIKPNQGGIMDSFNDCSFENIETMQIGLEETRFYAPVFRNIKLLTGEWIHGRVGALFAPCNQTAATLKASNVFADFVYFYRIGGGCMQALTAEQARDWFKNSGFQFGKNVTFDGYEGAPSRWTPFTIATTVFSAACGTGILIAVSAACYRCYEKRRRYQFIWPNPKEEKTPASFN